MARGDHIYVKRWRGAYRHHGIDLGDGTVVHFSGEPLRLRDACVVCDTLEDFCMGAAHVVVRYAQETRDAEEIVQTALSHLGQTGYQLWTNNCEHFASYCKTGRRESKQVRRAVRALAITGAAVALTGVVLAGRSMRRRATRNTA